VQTDGSKNIVKPDRIFGWIGEKDLPFAEAILASLVGTKSLSPVQERRKICSPLLRLLFFLAVAAFLKVVLMKRPELLDGVMHLL